MKTKHYLFFLTVFFLFSCSENILDENIELQKRELSEKNHDNSKLSMHQAEVYVSLFSSLLDENETPPEEGTRSSESAVKVLDNVDYLIENKDTILYVFNYKDDKGYIIVAGDNQSFPILAHSKEGNFNFKKANKNSPLELFLDAYVRNIKENRNADIINSDYFNNWKDLGKEGYEYEITLAANEPISAETRSRRKESSNKTSIYPYSGRDLDFWSQEGGYNFYAQNRARIGCPAISIGMLLYDTSQRFTGNMTTTFPYFDYYDRRDLSTVTVATETARKLRQIADSIPDYQWGRSFNAETVAAPEDILIGLRRVGFKNAQLVNYNFESLYNNLSFKGYNYFGQETTYNRGVLIGAWDINFPYSGHIWFCDGYYEQSYTVKKKFLGIVVSSWQEYDDRLYMNWGWGPSGGNGWYLATDNVWSSIEGNGNVNLKRNPLMYINLNYYANPQYLH